MGKKIKKMSYKIHKLYLLLSRFTALRLISLITEYEKPLLSCYIYVLEVSDVYVELVTSSRVIFVCFDQNI